MNYPLIKLFVRSALALFVVTAVTSCFDDGGSSVSLGSNTSGEGQLALTINKIQNLESNQWNQDTAGKIYLKTALVNIIGTCSRGVSNIIAIINGVQVAESAICKIDGSFSWDKNFVPAMISLGSAYDITLQAVSAAGIVISSADVSKTLVIDLVAPTAPVINSIAGCTLGSGVWVCNSASVQVTGWWSTNEDIVSLQAPASGALNQTPSTFTFDIVLSEGQARTLDFTVTDRAGNISGLNSVTVTYAATTSALASSVNTGGTSGFAGGPLGTNPSMIANVGTLSGQYFDLNSAFPNNQKVQLHVGPVAVGAQQINP
ncbi:MAG: hypothetical protein H7235_01050 [Bdellovibrionaceae bacterium]|nr:hypothetical protein [Pseudobdellovibrionaceae bacterium]